MKVVLAGLLLALCAGCGGDGDGDVEPFAVYHLETSIGRPKSEGELRCGPPRPVCPGIVEQPAPRLARYAVLREPALTGDDIDRASVRRTIDAETGAPVVVVDLTAEGTRAFARVTKEAARMGGRDLGWHHVAVVVGDEIVAFPEVDYDDYPDGFPDAPAIQIVAASDADARDLIERLRGGD
jgi:preprotein translocase subunit SecD